MLSSRCRRRLNVTVRARTEERKADDERSTDCLWATTADGLNSAAATGEYGDKVHDTDDIVIIIYLLTYTDGEVFTRIDNIIC